MVSPKTDTLKVSQMQLVSLKVFSDPFSTGKLCCKPRGRPQWRWGNSGRYCPSQALLSKWYFRTVLGAHTTPGRMILSLPGLKTKAWWLMHPRRCDQEEPISQTTFPSEGHPRKEMRYASPSPAPKPDPFPTHSLCHPLLCGKMTQQEALKLVLEGDLVLQIPCEGETRKA